MKFLLGTKLEMTQIFDETGKVIPVTLIEVIEAMKQSKNNLRQILASCAVAISTQAFIMV